MTSTPNSNRRTGIVITAACLGAVLIAGPLVGSQVAADDLTPKAQQALEGTPVSVAFTGREAVLTATTASAEEEAAAIETVENVTGVRWATFDGSSAGSTTEPTTSTTGDQTGTPSSLQVTDLDGVIHISGTVDSRDTADKIIADAKAEFGDSVVDELTIDDAAAHPTWLDGLPAVFSALKPVQKLDFSFDKKSAVLEGITESDSAGDTIGNALKDALPGITVVNNLGVDSGELDATDAATLAGLTILFEADSAVITSTAASVLDQVAAILTANPAARIDLVGHSAVATGTTAEEIAFSATRAQAAADYLVAQGITADRLTVSGDGTSAPVGDITTPEGQAANRRVTFTETKE